MAKNKKQRGFTLIELMIVVAIIGILAAVALPLLMDYLNSSKGSEGDLQIDAIEGKAKKWFYKHDQSYPTTTSAATPTAACCASADHLCAPVAADWTTGAWVDLNFHMTDKKFRFQYDYTGAADGKSYVAHAEGDLDCDNANGTTKITTTASITSGEPTNVRTRTEEN